MKITVLSGNPQPGGRTAALGLALAEALAELMGARAPVTLVELSDHLQGLFDREDAGVAALVEQVAASDVIVMASPVYKASFTGLLKSFLDRFGSGALRDRVAVPVFTGASPRHGLAPDYALRPVLIELGACVPVPSLYAVASELGAETGLVADYVALNRFMLLGAAHGMALARP